MAPQPSPEPEAVVDGCADRRSGKSEITLTAGGATHSIRIYVPSTSGDADELPTVLNWHGNDWTGDDHAVYTGFEPLAEQEDFIVVHPTGSLSPGLPVLGMGLGWELVDALDTPDRDDIAFARALIDELVANWCADPDRIYSIGMSNGAFFTSALVCELSDRLAAAASVAGVYHADACQPSEPVPYIAFHGTADPAVPYETGGDTIYPQLRETIFKLGAFDAFAAFANGAGCDTDPIAVVLGSDVTRYDYRNCDRDTSMSFYKIEGDGHTWPGGHGDVTTREINATIESWNFFAQHSRSDP